MVIERYGLKYCNRLDQFGFFDFYYKRCPGVNISNTRDHL